MSEDRRWFEQPPPEPKPERERGESPAKDLWTRCPGCEEVLYREDLQAQQQVCHHCGHHFRLTAEERIALLSDEGSFVRHDAALSPADPLGFFDSKPYSGRILASQAKAGEQDAFIAGSCTMDGVDVELGVFNFRFMGGSMGSVVGEAITRQYERAAERKGQVGSGDRSERIRTYNFPQGRVSDHRINLTLHKLDKVLEGEALDEFVDALTSEDQARKLAEVS